MINIQDRKLNKTMVFLTPMIAEGRKSDFFFSKTKSFSESPFFINAYHTDINKPWLNNHIFLVYKMTLTRDFILLEQQLRKIPNWVSDYSYIQGSIDLIVHVFKVPEEHSANLEYFKQGLYSKLDNNFKIEILRFWNVSFDSKLCSYLLKTKLTEKEKLVNLNKEYADGEHLPKPDNSEILPEMELIHKTNVFKKQDVDVI